MLLQHIINTIESVAPLQRQEEWDNSGLQVGDRNADIQAALLTTDVTESVVREAIELHCGLIISHHPLIFHPLKSIAGNTPQERCIAMAIRANIAIYSSHTSMDSYLHGVSGKMAEKIGITSYRILVASPQAERTNEYGLGVIGKLPQPIEFEDLLHRVKTTFGASYLRYTSALLNKVQTIALCGGAGGEYAEEAVKQGADVFITADIKYHDFLDMHRRIALIDMDHWTSEHFTREIFKELLEGHIPTFISQADQSPIQSI